ncbi:ankyrin repeat-containing domain protein [Hypoxylon sp. FL0543]|nr:ankyrin repeat-containing domain protein [Hypoxylon sp. FL0543]
MEQATIPSPSQRATSRLLGLPEELLLRLVETMSHDIDGLLVLAQANKQLYRITMGHLWKIDQGTRDSALYWACFRGNITRLRDMIKVGANVNHCFPAKSSTLATRPQDHPFALTPLTVAISHQQIDTAKVLLEEYGADVNLCSPREYYADTIEHRRWWNAVDPSTPLQWVFLAAMDARKRALFIELLIDHEASVEPGLRSFRFENRAPKAPILQALMDDGIPARVVEQMIAKTTDLVWLKFNIDDDFGYYEECVRKHEHFRPRFFTSNDLKKLAILRDAALDPDRRADGRTVWSHHGFLRNVLTSQLSARKREQLLALVLTRWHDINTIVERHPEQAVLVVALDCLVFSRKSELRTSEQRMDIIRLLQMLLDAGVDSSQSHNGDQVDIWTCSPFHGPAITALCNLCDREYCAEFEVGKLIDFLVKHGTPVDDKDDHGNTALHFASRYAVPPRLRQLIGYGADVNAADNHGRTAMHYVCRLDLPMLEADVDSPTATRHGSTGDRASIVRTLLEHGADPSTPDSWGFTPLHYACNYGLLKLVRLLLADPRVDVNAAAHDFSTPLHSLPWYHDRLAEDYDWSSRWDGVERFARRRAMDKFRIAQSLIAAGADVGAQDGNGWLPIVHARRHEHTKIVKLLLAKGGDDGLGR